MHPNPIFRQTSDQRNIAFARSNAFGSLVVSTDAAPLISHIPFFLTEDGAMAELHLVRSNPICRVVGDGRPATIAVQGPHGYVPPDWYGLEDQVPTWNYVAVHLIGRIEPMAPKELPAVLDRLSDYFESGLTPKPAWRLDKLNNEVAARMMRQILPFRFLVTDIQGTWKLGQNKPEEARLAAAASISKQSPELADLMRTPPDGD